MDVYTSLQELISEQPGSDINQQAGQIALDMKRLGPNCITEKEMELLIKSLKNDNDAIRFWAAVMIGHSGNLAKKAIPALKAAYIERPCEHDTTLNSAIAIHGVLKALGEKLPPVGNSCKFSWGR